MHADPMPAVVCLLLSLAAAAGGCGARAVAMVQDRSTSIRHPESPYREVRVGDTLYSIAWESGRDYRELARWNGLEAPYVIKPGQRLRLFPSATSTPTPNARDDYRVVARGDTLYAIARAAGVSYQDLAAWNELEPPYTVVPGQRLRVTPPRHAAAAVKRGPARATAIDADDDNGPIAWQWPAEGTIVARFAPNDGTKGVDIAGVAGQEIRAAAAGRVVYQGSGLRGYGQLIIIKHSTDFLSAYAHCAAIYVKEGGAIKAGQKIAAMGSSGTDRVKLHFEIRRRGVPVDPLEHLPKK